MPRTVLRQFTGGIANEIDPQNLRDDQGEEAVDINLKGFALEPGEGLAPLTDSGHYYYRGEWIKDSEAVSFEESGVGVVKTYDTKRPQFEEIINDKDNVARNLGPSLPPGAVITGTIVSEGTRGERPGDGSHLLQLPSDKLGAIDTADPITDAPSLVEHKATSTKDEDHIYYYSGQPYWVEKTGDTWNVKTRAYVNGAFTGNDITSGNLTRNSGGSFFKENYFICWNEQFIETVALSNSAMSVNSFDTIDTTQNGDVGSNFGFDSTSTYPATAKEITSVDICNGVVTFTQKIETADRAGAKAITKYTNSDDERWILPRKNDSYILLLRDGFAYKDWGYQGLTITHGTPAESSGAYNLGDDDVKVFTVANPSGDATWITPRDSINRDGFGTSSHQYDIGLKYIVKHFPKGTWGCVRQLGANKPEIMVIEANAGVDITAQNAKDVTVKRSFSETTLADFLIRTGEQGDRHFHKQSYYRLHIHINMTLPKIYGSIYWEGDPIPGKYQRYSDWTTVDNSGNQQKAGGGGLVYPTHERGGGVSFASFGNRFRWMNRHNPEYQTMSNPVHPTNWYGQDWNKGGGRHQFARYVARAAPGQAANAVQDTAISSVHSDKGLYSVHDKFQGLAKQPILFDGYGLVKNTIVHPLYYDNEGSERSEVAFKNTSIRLCSYTPGGAMTLQTHAGQSSIHTVATIDSSDSSISFDEATLTNFTAGDYIRVGGGHTAGDARPGPRRIGLNLPYNPPAKRNHDYFQARIKEVVATSPGKLKLEAIPGFENRYMRNINEQCYPTITTIDNNLQGTLKLQGEVPTQERKLIRTGLSANTLLGCSHGRRWGHIGEKENIEVRNDVGAGTTSSDYAHQIDWDGRTVRAVNLSAGGLRILYMKGGKLHSQNGIDSDITSSSTVFSGKGSFHLTDTLLTVVDNGNITVYDPNFNTQFVKGRPEKQTGLGLIGDIQDGISVSNAYGVFVFVKYSVDGSEYWKMVKTGTKPESTLLGFDFVKPIEFDGVYAWGTFKDVDNNYDIHTTVPFYESQIEGSWINYSANNNAQSAWGQLLKTRLSKADKDGNIKRWLAVDWKYDSGVWNSTGDPVIGLAHEANKMVGVDNEFTWYLTDAPDTLEYNAQGTVIEDPKIAIKFKSKIIRDVVFFKTTETVLPVSGATGAENQISFTNYEVAAQKFYVLNDNIIALNGENPEEQGYQMGQADTSSDAFDASRVGKSAFLVGAPNMYNPYGPNIDFYYRASFIDKWNNESVPSPLPTAGIEPLDSADDCIQMNLSPEFFRFDNEDITKIRVYRYGGDSSEFMFLTDIPIPTISSFPLAIPASGTGFTGTLAIKAALSPFYNLKTYYNISELSNFTNSAFDLTATPTAIDGSWRVNQVYEAETPTVAYGSGLAEDLNETDTTVKLIGTTNPSAWPTSGVIKLESEYISYSGISTNDLTGCVRGYYESTASQHKGGRVKPYSSSQDFNILPAGAGYGYTGSAGVYSSADVVATIESDGGTPAKLQVRKATHNLVNGVSVILKSTTVGGALPVGLVNTKNYFVVNKDNDTFQLALTSGGDAINVTGTDLGSGTFTYNGCVLYAATGGFNGLYTVDTGGGAITGASILNPGSGYTGVVGVDISDPGVGQTGASAVVAASVDGGGNATVVEWVLEMEHRNQDTTTLEAAIDTNVVPSTIYVADTSVFPDTGADKILIGNQIINYTGKTPNNTYPNQHSFTGCSHNASGGIATTHSVGVVVLSYNETYTEQTYTNISLEINALGFRDKARTPVMSLHSMKEDNWPPLAMTYNEEKKQFFETETTDDFFRYVTAVGSLYFGAVDADLRFSRYGSPEYWPLEAVVTLDSEIKGIMEHAGEGIVFTTNSVYRVRGTDPKAMVAFRVPDAKGIKDGDRHSIAEFNGGIIWKTASDGLCMYSGGRVNYLTRDKHNIPNMEKPSSCVADGVYWLLQRPKANREAGDTGNGFRLEIGSNDMKLCQTSIQAYHAYFAKALGKAVVVTSDNSLSADDTEFMVQEIGGTKADNISWRSKKIDVGEPASSKAFGSIAIVYESLESKTSPTGINGIRGEALAVSLLGLSADDLDAGDLNASASDGSSDLYDVFTKYDSVGQEFVADIGGTNWNSAQRKTIIMPASFDTSTVNVGDSVWAEDDTKNAMLADNTKVESVGSETSEVVVGVKIVGGGTNYGHDDGSGGFSSADIDLDYFTDANGKIELHATTPTGIADGNVVLLKSSGNLPTGLSEDTPYYVVNSGTHSVSPTSSFGMNAKELWSAANHGFRDNTPVVFSGNAQSGITNGTTYYIRPGTHYSYGTDIMEGVENQFHLALTVDGLALTSSAVGAGAYGTLTKLNGIKFQLATSLGGTPISIGSSSLGVVTGLLDYTPVGYSDTDGGWNDGGGKTYTGVTQVTSSGSGTGAECTIVTDGTTGLPTVTITNGGSGYVNHEQILFGNYDLQGSASGIYLQSPGTGKEYLVVTAIVDDTIIGTGTPSFNGCVLTGTGGGGTGFYGTYGTNASTGAITSVNIGSGGTGYTSLPTVVISDPGLANAGSGATIEASGSPTIILDKEPLRSGTGNIIWGNLPKVHIYINNESTPSRSFTLPPIVSDEPQSVDLYLDDLRKFRTVSIKVEGNLRINTLSLRHFPVQQFQSQTLHHSADVFYKGVVDFRVMLDGDLIYRKQLDNAGDEFTEERIYLPASSFGSRVHYMNESRGGMIESVTFNGSLAA